jgi:hypothetical protein
LSSRLLSKNVKSINIKNYNFIYILCGWETWCLILREEERQRVFENRVLKRIFGSKRDEGTRGWGKFHNEDVPPNIIIIFK